MQTDKLKALEAFRNVANELDKIDDTLVAFAIMTWMLGSIGTVADMEPEAFSIKVAEYVLDAIKTQLAAEAK